MSRFPSIDSHRTILEFIAADRPFAVAVVLKAEGSTPRKAGVKAVIDDAGRISGTIGGGRVEATAQARAVEAIQSKRPVVFDIELEGTHASDDDPLCGGVMRIVLDPTAAKDRAAYARAAEAHRQRERGVLLTTVRGVRPVCVSVEWFAEAAIPSEVGFLGAGAIRACLARETPRLFVEETLKPDEHLEVLVEPIVPQPRLLIIGGGHIGQAVALQASFLGFDITVLDDRPEFTRPALFPEGVTPRCGDIGHEVAEFPVDDSTYVVVVTRGHQHDATALAACIRRPAAYVGMIGSRRKVAVLRREFIESGRATSEEWARVFTPIGLDIGAVTVPEIATSIAAQLIAVRRKGAASAPPGEPPGVRGK